MIEAMDRLPAPAASNPASPALSRASRVAYRAFELVAWPATAWGVAECLLRVAVGPRDGLPAAALLAVCAAGTITFCRWRLRQLAPSR